MLIRMPSKPVKRRSLEGQRFQVIVIGGGSSGAAIARECARRGKRTLLVEQNDFASGTTSRSGRMIDCGLGHLDQSELSSIGEGIREKDRLLKEKPHLVSPMPCLLALPEKSSRNGVALRGKFWLYRKMWQASSAVADRAEESRLLRLLNPREKWSLFSFEEGQCEFPERLVIEWLLEAAEAGAVLRNYAQVLSIDVRHGRAQAVLLRDSLSGNEERVEGTWIVNASGPWVDQVCQRSRVETETSLITPVRGSHLVLPRFAGAPNLSILAETAEGGQFGVTPWNGQLLVGSTEVTDNGDPSKVEPSMDEIDQLMRSFAGLFPSSRFSSRDIKYVYAGLWALPYSPKRKLAEISRQYVLHDHKQDKAGQILSVIGGRLGTATRLAREVAERVGATAKVGGDSQRSSGREADRDPHLDPHLDPLLGRWTSEIADAGGISEASAGSIVEWHGKRAIAIAHMALSSAALRAPLCSHNEHIVAEAVDAFSNEHAVTLADVLLRRVPVALGGCWSQPCSREAAVRIGSAMGWSDQHTAQELEDFETERERFLRKPKPDFAFEAAAD